MNYHKAALGGTFDRLHIGHEKLLQTALDHAGSVIVGVTVDDLVVEKEFAHIIESFDIRFDAVQRWLVQHKRSAQEVEVVPLEDPFGPTLHDPAIDALVVTPQTKIGGQSVNRKRQSLKLTPLPILEADMVKDSTGEYVSSTRIRQGSITRTGHLYASLVSNDITFSPELLTTLSKVQGEIVAPARLSSAMIKEYSAVVLVGDVVTETFVARGLPFTYAIIDGKTKRHHLVDIHQAVAANLHNPAGMIKHEAAEFFQHLSHEENKIFRISGEEDLLAFLPILFLPLHSALFYGQPDVGIGMITVNEAAKLKYARMINPSFC